jgi:arylsulfatase A-like enzyme
MNKLITIEYFAGVILFGLISNVNSQKQAPNVLFILSDDQGSDLGCWGNKEIKTPAVDALAQISYRFTNFHSGTSSSPTRAGLMTGKNGNTTGVWHTLQGRTYLDRELLTLPETFSYSGYATGIFGKWHLGDVYPYRAQDRGFQESLIFGGGAIGQQVDYWGNTYFDDTYIRNGKLEKQNGYCTDIWFDEAMKFMKKNKEKPFFCYLSLNAPHSPFHIDEKYVSRYRNNPNIPNPEIYGMISNIDENIEELTQFLKHNNLDKNTIIIYMTDNGVGKASLFNNKGYLQMGYNAGLRGRKGSPYEGGHRVPFMIHIPGMKAKEIPTLSSYIDIMPTIIEICQLQIPRNAEFDGVSLFPLLKGRKIASRFLIVDTQREEYLKKNKSYCVMSDRWRLISGKELFDINKDREQRINVAKQYPKVVSHLKEEYEKWWEKTSVKGDQFQYLDIGELPETCLMSHDLHNEQNQTPVWNQEQVREAIYCNGFWTVEVSEKGLYQFQLYRWAPESGLALSDAAPTGKEVFNGKAFPVGKAIKINGAKIRLNNQEYTTSVTDNKKVSIDFSLFVEKGKYRLSAEFTDSNKVAFSAYYVVIKKINHQTGFSS